MKIGLRGLVCLVMLAIIQPASAQEKPIEEQILDIITSSNDTVRKWMRAPKLVVVYDQDSYEEEINALVEEINTRVIGFPGFWEVEYFGISGNSDDLFGQVQFNINNSAEGGSLVLIANNIVHLRQGDIFIFLTETKIGTLFGEIVATEDAIHHRRRFSEDIANTTCYEKTASADDELQVGWIFINSDDVPELIKHCIYEELTQVLGLLHDTELSSVFTYNDRSGPMSDTSADFMLLNALYSNSVYPGFFADEVIAEFSKLLNMKK